MAYMHLFGTLGSQKSEFSCLKRRKHRQLLGKGALTGQRVGGATRRVEAVSGESLKPSESLVDLEDACFAQSYRESNHRERGGRKKEEAMWRCIAQERGLGGPRYARVR